MVTDQDLVYLAGNSVYQSDFLPDDYIHNINGKEYRLVEKKQNVNPQYAVYQNVKTGEYILALNGTNVKEPEDVLTDLQLAGEGVPELHQKALDLFNRLNAKYGFSAVCGNSLGGSLANFISVNTGVRSVTINPAVLPNDPQTLAKPANNITNYIATGDPLNRVQVGADIKSAQMRGKCVNISFGVMNFKGLLPSHVGYAEVDEETGISRIDMGEGKVDIEIDASKHIVINPFSNLHAGETPNDFEIEINSETMGILKNEIVQIKNECDLSKTYINQVVDIAQHYESKESFKARKEKVIQSMQELFFSLGLSTIEFVCHDKVVSDIIDLTTYLSIDIQKFINAGLDILPPPFNIIDLIESTVGILVNIPDLLVTMAKAINDVTDDLFYDVYSQRYDEFVNRLTEASQTINNNSQILNNKLQVLENQVTSVHNYWIEIDDEMGTNISDKNNLCSTKAISIESSNNEQFQELSTETLDVINNYEKLIDENFKRSMNNRSLINAGELASLLVKDISDVLEYIDTTVEGFENALEICDIVVTRYSFEDIVNQLELFRDKVKNIFSQILDPLQKFSRIEEILTECKPYIISLIFSDESYDEVIMYYDAARLSYDSNRQMLHELIICIDENQNETIKAIKENMDGIKNFSESLCSQIDKTVIHN